MTETTTVGICGSVRPFTDARCVREPEHPGQHKDAKNVKWGGRMAAYAPQKIRTLLAGKPLAPYRPPASRFTDIPGQAAMDFGSDGPDALIEETAAAAPAPEYPDYPGKA